MDLSSLGELEKVQFAGESPLLRDSLRTVEASVNAKLFDGLKAEDIQITNRYWDPTNAFVQYDDHALMSCRLRVTFIRYKTGSDETPYRIVLTNLDAVRAYLKTEGLKSVKFYTDSVCPFAPGSVRMWAKTRNGYEEQRVRYAQDEAKPDKLERIFTELLKELEPGYDGELRGGLRESPRRMAKAWRDWTSGYAIDPASVLKVFEDGASGYDAMVVRKGIPLRATCEHHGAAIMGTVTIAYIPNGKIVGLSKLDRLVDVFGRRLQVQERLTVQIADAIETHLRPLGVGVWVSARHLCIESRGVKHQDSTTITTALRGEMMTDPSVKAEFLSLCRT